MGHVVGEVFIPEMIQESEDDVGQEAIGSQPYFDMKEHYLSAMDPKVSIMLTIISVKEKQQI